MTPEQRLKQTEILLGTAAKVIQNLTTKTDANAEAIERNTESIDRLSQNMQQLREMFVEYVGIMGQMNQRIEEMQAEVRGLQVENRRIIERVFGEEN